MKQERHHIVDILFVLALFAVFTVSALVLVTIGADVYQHTVQDMSINYEQRVSSSYVIEKLRQNDITIQGEGISYTTLSGEPALMLPQEINEVLYITYIYHYDGHLKELFMKADGYVGENMLAAGQDIMELDDLQITPVSDQLLSLEMIQGDGSTHQVYVALRSDVDVAQHE